MSRPLLLPSVSFVIRETGPVTLGPDKSPDQPPALQILQKIATSLSQNGYRAVHLKRRSASIAILRCRKGQLRVGMILSAVAGKDGVFHCELDIWRVHSIFDNQAARSRKMQRDIDLLRELYCVIDRHIRVACEMDAIRWAAGAKGLRLIGNNGRPQDPATSLSPGARERSPAIAGAE